MADRGQLDVERPIGGVAHREDEGRGPLTRLEHFAYIEIALALDRREMLQRVDERDLHAEVPGKGRHPHDAFLHAAVGWQRDRHDVDGREGQADAKVGDGKLHVDGLRERSGIAQFHADLRGFARARRIGIDGDLTLGIRWITGLVDGNGRMELFADTAQQHELLLFVEKGRFEVGDDGAGFRHGARLACDERRHRTYFTRPQREGQHVKEHIEERIDALRRHRDDDGVRMRIPHREH